MTLPASFPMSMSQIATELGLSLPLSINHAWVIALAGKSALPVSFSDLLGKTAQPTWSATPNGSTGVMTMSVPFFGGTAIQVDPQLSPPGQPEILTFSVAPNWSGNILLKNVSTGASGICTKQNSTTWSTPTGGILRPGVNDNYLLAPSN